MENASKALIIVGGVFIAIVILVIAVELFVGYRGVVENYDKQMAAGEITKINKEFTKYLGREDITIQEIVTAIRTAKNYNQKYGNTNLIEVKINGISKMSTNNQNYPELIKDNIENRYKCDIDYYKEETDDYKGLIKYINFK